MYGNYRQNATSSKIKRFQRGEALFSSETKIASIPRVFALLYIGTTVGPKMAGVYLPKATALVPCLSVTVAVAKMVYRFTRFSRQLCTNLPKYGQTETVGM